MRSGAASAATRSTAPAGARTIRLSTPWIIATRVGRHPVVVRLTAQRLAGLPPVEPRAAAVELTCEPEGAACRPLARLAGNLRTETRSDRRIHRADPRSIEQDSHR